MKAFLLFCVGGVLGLVAGAGGMLIAYPFVFPPPAVNETVADSAGAALLTTRFREDSPGQDAGHWGRGGVKAYAGQDGDVLLELQADFEVGPGPNFWIYLNGAADIEEEKDFLADGGRVKIAQLKSFTGSQVYALPKDAFAGAGAVTIWCESFGQYIASANL